MLFGWIVAYVVWVSIGIVVCKYLSILKAEDMTIKDLLFCMLLGPIGGTLLLYNKYIDTVVFKAAGD